MALLSAHHHLHHRSVRAICRVKHNIDKAEHEDPIEPAENIVENKEGVNETSIDNDNVGTENMCNNPEVMKTDNQEATEMVESVN